MSREISLISWNVNGIRAIEKKGFLDFFNEGKYDILAVQETKVSDEAVLSGELLTPKGAFSYWHGAKEKKGYSGVAVFTRLQPEKVKTNFGNSILSAEGRMIELHFPEFILLNIYFPNGGRGEERLQYKLKFYQAFLVYLEVLKKTGKPIIFTGDVNTAHQPIDLARPKENEKVSGFMPIEREWLDQFEQAGFVDTFRQKKPTEIKYSWWDMKSRARDRNIGWRIDYFYTSAEVVSKIKEADILTDVFGSDHAPIKLTLRF